MTNFEIACRFAGMTGVKLAEQLGVTPGYISQLQTDRRGLSRDKARELARVLDVSPAWLMGVAESLILHDPINGDDFTAPIMRSEELAGYGMLYHVYLDETGDIVPVILSDGLQFTPTDWSGAQAIKCAADIRAEAEDRAGVRWMDWRGQDAIMLDGLPRVFL